MGNFRRSNFGQGYLSIQYGYIMEAALSYYPILGNKGKMAKNQSFQTQFKEDLKAVGNLRQF